MAKNQRMASVRVRGVDAKGGGTASFIGQRVSALVLLVLCPWFALATPLAARQGYDGVQAFLLDPLHAWGAGVLVAAASGHMFLGVTEIIEDYIHKPASKTALITLSALVCLAAAAAGVAALIILNLRA